MESEAIFFKLMGSLSDICWVRVLYGISVICLLFSCRHFTKYFEKKIDGMDRLQIYSVCVRACHRHA